MCDHGRILTSKRNALVALSENIFDRASRQEVGRSMDAYDILLADVWEGFCAYCTMCRDSSMPEGEWFEKYVEWRVRPTEKERVKANPFVGY